MKKSMVIFAMLAFFLAACNSNKKNTDDTSKVLSSVDTSGLHQFQMWKQHQELRDQEIIQTNGINEEGTMALNNYAGNNPIKNYAPANYENNEVRTSPYRTKTPAKQRTARTSRVGSGTSGSNSVGQGTAQTTKKKGWSKAAKGAVIGAGSGAVLGAIVSKKKGKGAIIGGIIGAGGGYVLGRMKDKKDGRY